MLISTFASVLIIKERIKMTKEEIITGIRSYFGFSVFTDYSNYYVGITNDIKRRLFDEHNVSEQKDYWIYRTADSKSIAQEIEKYFLNLGMQGDTGGGTDDTCIIYCYRITSSTIE